ncbi:MAG TPA: hypothetical protein EYH43_01915 [Persephonella sp.]|nr:hypothetical protein [Hydrogenothermaceae bacterium]HIQ24724.1 hypothetical protein [Persephonella sp.]
MRFVVQHKKAVYINFLVVLFSLAIYPFLSLYTLFKYLTNELFPEDIILALQGNPEEFLEPKSIEAIIEAIHIESFLSIILFITLLSIFIRVNLPDKVKIYVSMILFIFYITYIFSIFAVRFGLNFFSYTYFISFIGFIFLAFGINTINLFAFLTGKIK